VSNAPADFDILDFRAFTNVTGGFAEISKATSPSLSLTSGLVLFRSGSAESANTIAAAFAVETNNDFVATGSVNDLVDAAGEMIFGLRTTDANGFDTVNFWHWKDDVAGENASDGNVQGTELTLLLTLENTSMTTLATENFLWYAPT
jgi:hypothetical protein